jgi:DUF1009 family protein
MMQQPIALILGRGNFCFLLKKTLEEQGRPFFVLAYQGITDPELTQGCDHAWISLGHVGRGLDILRSYGVKEISMAGTWQRPAWSDLMPDTMGLKLLTRLGMSWSGDDRILKVVQAFLAEQGFDIVSPQSILPSLVTQPGSLGTLNPCLEALQDIDKGAAYLTHLSCLDFGQGLALQKGLVLAVEAAEGTDQCILRTGPLKRTGPGPVYVKMAKQDQSYDLDLPVIGPGTIRSLVQAGFQGLAFQSHSVLVAFGQEMAEMADKQGIFLWGF